jgi:hypothetical protein
MLIVLEVLFDVYAQVAGLIVVAWMFCSGVRCFLDAADLQKSFIVYTITAWPVVLCRYVRKSYQSWTTEKTYKFPRLKDIIPVKYHRVLPGYVSEDLHTTETPKEEQ